MELVRRGLGTGSGVVVGGEAEDFVHLEDEVAAFGLGEFAFGVFEFLEGGAGTGAGFAVLPGHNKSLNSSVVISTSNAGAGNELSHREAKAISRHIVGCAITTRKCE